MRNQGFQYFHDVEINHELSEDEMESHYVNNKYLYIYIYIHIYI